MSFTRTRQGDRVVLDRNGAQVHIGPDASSDDTTITFVGLVKEPSSAWGFDADELALLIDELIDQHDRMTGCSPICDECVREAMLDELADDVGYLDFGDETQADWRDKPIGKVVPYAYRESNGEDERLRNRIVVPFQVGELLEMVDGLQPEDVLEVRVPIG